MDGPGATLWELLPVLALKGGFNMFHIYFYMAYVRGLHLTTKCEHGLNVGSDGLPRGTVMQFFAVVDLYFLFAILCTTSSAANPCLLRCACQMSNMSAENFTAYKLGNILFWRTYRYVMLICQLVSERILCNFKEKNTFLLKSYVKKLDMPCTLFSAPPNLFGSALKSHFLHSRCHLKSSSVVQTNKSSPCLYAQILQKYSILRLWF